ncbi:MAG: tetratricopeptide repeat protein [Pseudomonadota bacterium]
MADQTIRTCKASAALVAVIAVAACATSSGQSTPADSSLADLNVSGRVSDGAITDRFVGPYLSARISARENALLEAAQAFDAVAQNNPTNDRLIRQAFFYNLAGGNVEAAIAYAKTLRELAAQQVAGKELVVASEDTDGLARLALATDAVKRASYSEVDGLLEQGSSEPFVAALSHLMKAWAEYGIEGPVAGLAALQKDADDLFTGFHPMHVAFMAEPGGDLGLAMEAYRNSVFGLGGPVGRAAYGAFLERHGEKLSAQGYYELIAKQPGPDRRLAMAGLERLEAGEASTAYASVDVDGGSAIALYSFAAFLLEQFAEQREQADAAGFNIGEPRYNLPLSLAQLALYLDPTLAEARRLIGVVNSIYGDQAGAIAALEPITPDSPHYVQAQIEIAGALSALGDERKAISNLKRVLRKFPDAVELRFALSGLAASQGDDNEAVRQLTFLIDSLGETPEKDAWRYYVSRGDALIKLERWPEAEVDLKRAVDLAPDEPTALNYLGYSWAERGVNLEEAFDLIEKAVEGNKTSGAIIDSLGWAYYQTGNFEKAVENLEVAAALEPSDPTITEHLGDAYWRLDRQIEARFQWERALELEPSDKQEKSLTTKLADGLPPFVNAAPTVPSDAAPVDFSKSIMTSPVVEPEDEIDERSP